MLSIMEEENICKECQRCCRYLTFVISKATYKMHEDFWQVRGCKALITHGSDVVALRVPSDCQHISKNVGCAIYHRRPAYCRNYDGRLDPFFKDLCVL